MKFGKFEARNPAHRLERGVARRQEPFAQRPELAPGGHAVEAADPHVHRMDRAPADQLEDLVADLLELQPALDDGRVIGREVDRALVAEEIGRVEQVHVQRVALDPLAAVQETTQFVQRSVDRDAARRFDRVACAHLVGDRADSADARRDVGRLREPAAAQERLEEPRRLVDAQLYVVHLAVVDLDVHRALALDARDRVDFEGAVRGAAVGHGSRLVRLGRDARRRPLGTGASPR